MLRRNVVGDLTQGSIWHVLPKGLPQAASLLIHHHSKNTTPCLLPLQGHTHLNTSLHLKQWSDSK